MLRDAVASAIGRENRSFRLRKSHPSTPEIRPGPETLNKKGFYNLMTLNVSPGRPLELDEEAITVAPVDVGFRPGLRPVPLPVVEALAMGRNRRRNSSRNTSVDADTAAVAAVAAAAAAASEAGGRGTGEPPKLADGLAEATESTGAVGGGCCLLKFPEVDAETGPVAPLACAATAPPSADCSPSLGPLGRGGRGGCEGGEGDDGVASDLLLSLRGVGAPEEEGSGGSEAPTASVSSSSETEQSAPTATPCGSSRLGVGGQQALAARAEEQEAALGYSTCASSPSSYSAAALPASTDAAPAPTVPLLPGAAVALGSEDAPTVQARVDRAATAAAAAAAALSARAETEVLTSTYVEVVPPESRWGEQFTVAVHRDSSVGDIRHAVWSEMHRRGLGPETPPPDAGGGGGGGGATGGDDSKHGEDDDDRPPPPPPQASPRERGEEGRRVSGTIRHPLEAEAGTGWTPAALRLRERQVKLPATIIRDASGTVTRLRSQLHGAPWVLAAQVLPHEEDLGRPAHAASSGCGGGNGSAEEAGSASGGGGEAEAEGAASLVLPPEDAVVVVLQWWNRWEWRLTEKYEAWISPSETVANARRRLAGEVRPSFVFHRPVLSCRRCGSAGGVKSACAACVTCSLVGVGTSRRAVEGRAFCLVDSARRL